MNRDNEDTGRSWKREPSRERSRKIDEVVTPELIDQVLHANPARSTDELRARIERRLGYRAGGYARMSARVNRWKANRQASGRRMPSHIRGMAVAVEIVDRALAEFNRREAEKTSSAGLLKGAAGAVKRLAKDFASEVKAQQA